MDAAAVNNVEDVKEKADNETREEKFIRMGQARMNKVLDSIRLLKNLSNRSSYAYTDEQIDKMFLAINAAVEDAKSSFSATKKEDADFHF